MLEPFLIVGLGNIGKDYAFTRHNVGFMVLDCFLDMVKVSSSDVKFKGEYKTVSFELEKERCIKGYLLKPHTYMNLSGESVRALCDYYKLPPSNVLVIHDDVDLPLGIVRIKRGGGDAGHNGLKSITSCLGTNDYYRLRVGVGRPKVSSYEMKDWVLSRFSKEEEQVILKISEYFKQNFILFLNEKFAMFQERINSVKVVFEEINR